MNEITHQKPSALQVMGNRFNVEPLKLLSTLKSTVFKGASDDEMLALVVVANEYKLNPLTKEIYAFPQKGGGITPIVSIDGWNRIANEHPQMDGFDFESHYDEAGKLNAITCSIYRKDRSRPVRVTEYLAECKRGTEPWKMEHRMLRHKAFIQAVRMAFGFSGIYDEDEAERIVSAKPGRGKELAAPVNPFADDADEIPGIETDPKPAAKPKSEPKEEPAPVETGEDDPDIAW